MEPLRDQAELDDFLSGRPGAVPLLHGGRFVVRGRVAVEAVGESEVALEGGTATLYEHARAEVWGGRVEAWDDALPRPAASSSWARTPVLRKRSQAASSSLCTSKARWKKS